MPRKPRPEMTAEERAAWLARRKERREERRQRRRAIEAVAKRMTAAEDPRDARIAAMLRARGEQIEDVAIALEFTYRRARQICRRADVLQMVKQFRELHKVQSLDRIASNTPRVFDRLEQAIDDPSPAAVTQIRDLAAAVVSFERSAASAAGETQRGPAINITQQQLTLAGGNAADEVAAMLRAWEEEPALA